jgi:hypothetical protein
MAKQSGLGDNLYVAGYDLSGDIGALDAISGSLAVIDVTGIDKSAPERLGGKRDGLLSYSAFLNDAAGQEHPRLSQLPTADQIATYCRGTALGGSAACINAKQLNYDGNRGADGALTFKVSAQANAFGLEWGTQLTPGKRTDAAATNGPGVDLGATWAASFGLQAYLHVFAFAGTSVTVKIQHSNDNGGTDPYADIAGAAFTAATAITAQRIATANNVAIKRWLRAVTVGTFTNAVFSAVAVPNATAVSF